MEGIIDDPTLKLALALHANPGIYALLLGSGVSRSAGIFTGWEVVLDLINKIAIAEEGKIVDNPESWYIHKFGIEPKYDDLLRKLTSTSTERMALLRSYFEPNEQEREDDLKVPTPAHKAIAKLVKGGYIRMILTTNFDRLLEIALEEEGVIPDVIRSDDAMKGAMPYVHSKCYLVKLHGDYRDTRLKNTPEELEKYSEKLRKSLDRILDDFGLIVCGWSAEYDVALRQAILRAPNRRFTTFWLARGEIKPEAEEIIAHRRAEKIPIEGAEIFFPELQEKVLSLEEYKPSNPISKEVAIATIRCYLDDPTSQYKIDNLIREEIEAAYQKLSAEKFDIKSNNVTFDDFINRITQYELVIDKLVGMLSTISFYDKGRNSDLLVGAIERFIQPPRYEGNQALFPWQQYPAMILAYASGICALVSSNFLNLSTILLKPKFRNTIPIRNCLAIARYEILLNDPTYWYDVNKYTPLSDRLFELLKTSLNRFIPNKEAFEDYFDIFEYILALTYLNIFGDRSKIIGHFVWRLRTGSGVLHERIWDKTPMIEFIRSGLAKGDDWELIKAGFFNGSHEKLNQVFVKYNQLLSSSIQSWQ